MSDGDDGRTPAEGGARPQSADRDTPVVGRAGRHAPPPPGAGAPAAQDPPRWRGRRRPVLAFLALLLVLAAAALGVAYELLAVSATPTPVTFEVRPGWGGKRVARELAHDRLVRSALVFELYLRARGWDRSVGAGLYDLNRAMSAPDIAAALRRGGRPRTAHIVIPEGWRAGAIVRRLASAGISDPAALGDVVSSPGDLRPPFVPQGASLEGYLFPDSYDVPVRSTARDALKMMLERFGLELDARTDARLRSRGLSVHAWVTLASMVQAEAASPGEMPVIAGVFLNRLERDMPLQSDPTVAYGLGKALPQLTAADLRIDTPWNTYTRAGLPRGPIGNPGRDALAAVLDPVRRDDAGNAYLYFLHGHDGDRTVFRPNTTLEAHNRDVRTFLQNDGP